MPTIQIWDKPNRRIFQALRAVRGQDDTVRVSLGQESGHGRMETLPPDTPDVLVLAPGYQPTAPLIGTLALVPGANAGDLPVKARSVMTFGLKSRDSLTLSSSEDGRMAVALQRDFIDVFGHPIERQEFLLDRPSGLSREETLCYVGAQLLLGMTPEAPIRSR